MVRASALWGGPSLLAVLRQLEKCADKVDVDAPSSYSSSGEPAPVSAAKVRAALASPLGLPLGDGDFDALVAAFACGGSPGNPEVRGRLRGPQLCGLLFLLLEPMSCLSTCVVCAV